VPGYGETAAGRWSPTRTSTRSPSPAARPSGRKSWRTAADTLKKVSSNGGKSPNIVFADADLDAAAKGAFKGIFFGKGRCARPARAFSSKRRCTTRSWRSCSPCPAARTRRSAQHQNAPRAARFARADGESPGIHRNRRTGGAIPVLRGGRAGERGFFVRPAIFDGRDSFHAHSAEEIFGPVLSTLTFTGMEDLLEKANGTNLRARRGRLDARHREGPPHGARTQAGTVWINSYNMLCEQSPFGGYKHPDSAGELGSTGWTSTRRSSRSG